MSESEQIFGNIFKISLLILMLNVNQSCVLAHKKDSITKEELPEGSSAMIELISKDKISINEVPPQYLDNKQFVLELLSKYIYVFGQLPEKYHDDFDVVLKAKNLASALKYASNRLKDNKDLIKIFVMRNGMNLRYASDRLKNDLEIINLALNRTAPSIEYVPKKLITKEMVVLAIKQDKDRASETYSKIPELFKADKEIFNIAYQENYTSFEHIPPLFKKDENYILELVAINPHILNYDFELKKLPSFQKSLKDMMISGKILFDEKSPYRKISFLNLLYFSEYAKDDGISLSLKLKNGKFVDIKYILGEKTGHGKDEYNVPSFWGYIKDLGFYIVSIGFYEGSEVYLIDDETGRRVAQIHDYPNISSDRGYIVYAQSVDAYNFSGIEIFKIKPHQAESVYSEELYGFNFDSWLDPKSFLVKSQLDGGYLSVEIEEKENGSKEKASSLFQNYIQKTTQESPQS